MSLKEVLDKIIAIPVPGKRGKIKNNKEEERKMKDLMKREEEMNEVLREFKKSNTMTVEEVKCRIISLANANRKAEEEWAEASKQEAYDDAMMFT